MHTGLPSAIRARAKSPFVRHRTCGWIRTGYPPETRVSDVQITQAELSEVMRWKLLRGKARPKLQAYVDELPDATVRAASSAAFALATKGQVKGALDALSKPLKGVGPATASAILAAYDQRIPFMSDEALALLGGKPKYTLAESADLTQLLGRLARVLQRAEPAGSARRWTAQCVQQAVWAAAHLPGIGSARIAAASSRLLAGAVCEAEPEEQGGEGAASPPLLVRAGAADGVAEPPANVLSPGAAGPGGGKKRSRH